MFDLARIQLVVMSGAAVWLLAQTSEAQSLGIGLEYPIGQRPVGIGVADLDADGALDVVAALRDVDSIGIAFGDGAGGFGAPVELFTESRRPMDVAIGDVDGDGVLDVLTANGTGRSVSVFRGVGGGQFATPDQIDFTRELRQLALADLDLDGDLDLVVGSDVVFGNPLTGEGKEAAYLRVAENDGAGGFTGVFELPLGAEPVLDLTTYDLDGDGLDEVIASASWKGTQILRNQGGLTFTAFEQPGTFGGFTRSTAFTDVDHDGDPDLIWVEEDGLDSDVEMAPNDGTGSFQTFLFQTILFSNERYERVRVGDLDGDGETDVVAVGGYPSFQAPESWIHVRHGAPGFAMAPTLEKFNFDGLAVDLVLADVDGDGLDDAVVCDPPGGRFHVMRTQVCGAATQITGVKPAQLPVVAAPDTFLTVGGCGLGSVSSVTLGGVELPFALDPEYAGGALEVELPPVLAPGPQDLVLTSPGGAVSVTLDVAGVLEPTLSIDPPAAMPVSGSAALHVAADPGGLAFLGVSPNLSPTVVPGLFELAIGAGGSTLFSLAAVPLDPTTGSAALPIPTGGLTVGLTVHFQAVVATLPTASFPLPPTNTVTATVVP